MGSKALAELIARSPGARIGGVALKSKTPRTALVAPIASEAGPGAGLPPAAIAAVMPASPGPEGLVPGVPAGAFPSDVVAPGVPVVAQGAAGSAAPIDFGSAPGPSTGGLAIFGGGGGGGGGGSGGGGGGGGSTGTVPGGTVIVPPAPPPPMPGIPEPSTWLLLIAGFGLIGQTMRRGRRAIRA